MRKYPKLVLCEIDSEGSPIRIFRNVKDTFSFPVESVQEFPKAFAVGMIRSKVFRRAGCTPHQDGECENCSRPIIWKAGYWNSGHMHEKVFKGRGGEVSVENGVAICRDCHLGPNGAHGDRRWQTAKLKET